MRTFVAETHVAPADLVQPFFVRQGKGVSKPVESMPGVNQISRDVLVPQVKETHSLGLRGVLLFGIPDHKDPKATGAYADDGVIQDAVRAIKDASPESFVITDVCLCGFTDHGHCGIVVGSGEDARIDNDSSVDLLARTAVSHARAGADMVAPSAMMDGQVAAIRKGLDAEGFGTTPIMSYSAKYASAMYGPFRDAAESPPQFGDRRSYQMDVRNSDEAMREIALDIEEGADVVMVKPALAYLDIIRRAKDRYGHPMAAYNVSGEYSMVKAAADRGWLEEQTTAIEILTAIKRAGADLILTYWAQAAARWLG
jgi:porphobilinogen synthase